MGRGKQFTVCQNCNADVPLPDMPQQAPRKITVFDFGRLAEHLFTTEGATVVMVVFALGIGGLVAIFGEKDSEYNAIKKALDTPGIRVEVTKDSDGVDWKIIKDETE